MTKVVLIVIAIVLFAVSAWPAAVQKVHLGWLGLCFLAAALVVN
jgi:hypothetical protein